MNIKTDHPIVSDERGYTFSSTSPCKIFTKQLDICEGECLSTTVLGKAVKAGVRVACPKPKQQRK